MPIKKHSSHPRNLEGKSLACDCPMANLLSRGIGNLSIIFSLAFGIPVLLKYAVADSFSIFS